METPDDRAAELVAAAAAGELTPAERIELDRLRRVDPGVDDEIAALRAVIERVRAAESTWIDAEADDALRARVLAATGGAGEAVATPSPRRPEPLAPVAASTSRRRPWIPALVAAACLVVGVVVGAWAPGALNAPPVGPPGTLGAVEPVDLRDESAGVRIDGDVVAHTWGTESVIRASGLTVGATYTVVLIGSDGSEFPAGEMLGSEVPIDCRLNAAVLREDVAGLEIRTAEGEAVAVAELPAV